MPKRVTHAYATLDSTRASLVVFDLHTTVSMPPIKDDHKILVYLQLNAVIVIHSTCVGHTVPVDGRGDLHRPFDVRIDVLIVTERLVQMAPLNLIEIA